ncbi:LOW QUALITY PROTEIN: hypothetical protein PHMEG_00023260 [Phytophthora megakarya]|uniref:Uncharacterized protein n=1 Tax=Phytophthora megakarya TaxID=4795 RepID=A0A225VHH7_9STRA|nr:LOW QUALITY PROTEIN: hypothetical protein PHMEG_00023260 [Phytophthora megakarya]
MAMIFRACCCKTTRCATIHKKRRRRTESDNEEKRDDSAEHMADDEAQCHGRTISLYAINGNVLAYGGSHDETWFKLECELYERWLASQPPLDERQPYTWPTSILQKLDECSSDGDDSLSPDEQWSMEPVARSVDNVTDGLPVGDDPRCGRIRSLSPTPTESSDVNQEYNNPPTETHSEEKSPDAAVADLEHTFMCVMHVLSTEGNDGPSDDDYADYAQELAFLPDLTEPSATQLDYTAPNVKNSSFIGDQQRRRA